MENKDEEINKAKYFRDELLVYVYLKMLLNYSNVSPLKALQALKYAVMLSLAIPSHCSIYPRKSYNANNKKRL